MSETQLIRCPSCGATNRVPREKIERGLAPVCGRCKTALPVDLKPLTVTDSTFRDDVERSPLPVALDVWAAWCPPCRALAPVIDRLADRMAGRVRFAKLDADENPQTTTRFKVDSLPTLLVFNAGVEVDRIVGLVPESEIARRLERVSTPA
jgi:thioredoxin 2